MTMMPSMPIRCRLPRDLDGERRREFGDAGDDRHAAARDVLRRFHDGDLLGAGQRRVLAHRAADDEARDAVADQAVDDPARSRRDPG